MKQTKRKVRTVPPPTLSGDELALCAVIARIVARKLGEGKPTAARGKR